MNSVAKITAFTDLKTTNLNLEKFLEDKLHVNDDELFDEINFGIDKKLQFNLRPNNPLLLVTTNIINSMKKTINNYNYEFQLQRRELTSPHEGNVKLFII
jgi:hypothetical protein